MDAIVNVFDPNRIREQKVQQKFKELPGLSKAGISLKYKSIPDLFEHRIDILDDYLVMRDLYSFIESAASEYSSCLIVSAKNKCSPIAVACCYLIMKLNWSVIRSLEYINSKKIDIEITRTILKQLQKLENQHENMRSVGVKRSWQIDKQVMLKSNSQPE